MGKFSSTSTLSFWADRKVGPENLVHRCDDGPTLASCINNLEPDQFLHPSDIIPVLHRDLWPPPMDARISVDWYAHLWAFLFLDHDFHGQSVYATDRD